MQKQEEKRTEIFPKIEEMFSAGVHYGYTKSRRHPSLSSFIYATKNGGDIINLEKTSTSLLSACSFVEELGAQNKILLFVGTKPEAKNIVREAAEILSMPYAVERWIGGTISNFSEIKKRITALENYRKDSKGGELEKYTKKERSVMAKQMEKLTKYYSGLIGLKKSPDAIYIVDAKKEYIAATEAKSGNIPVVAMVNSDSNIKNIKYPIVGNDSSVPSIRMITETLVRAYKKGQASTKKV